MRKREISLLEWLFLFAAIALMAWFLDRPSTPKPFPKERIIASHNPSITPLWVQTNYYMYSGDDIRMVALSNKLFIVGATMDNGGNRLIALDARTGDILWQYGNANIHDLTVSANRLFVGELGGGRVTALNPDTGGIEWSVGTLGGNVTNILVRENILYVDTVGRNHLLFDANTGNLLKAIPYTVDKAPNPDIPFWSDHNMGGQFVGDMRFFQRMGADRMLYKGEITAFDDVSGNQIWSSDSYYAITRMATSPFGVFVLDPGGNLLKFNLIDGVVSSVIQFAPAPTLYDADNQTYGYYVAVDSDNQLLFVFLGDSAQMFAFELSTVP